MLPDADDRPPGLAEETVRLRVPGLVAFDLCPPELGVLAGSSQMLGTAMPVAAVDEDGHLESREDDIGGASQLGEGLAATRYRNPCLCSSDRSRSSGLVSLFRLPCIEARTAAEEAQEPSTGGSSVRRPFCQARLQPSARFAARVSCSTSPGSGQGTCPHPTSEGRRECAAYPAAPSIRRKRGRIGRRRDRPSADGGRRRPILLSRQSLTGPVWPPLPSTVWWRVVLPAPLRHAGCPGHF